MADTEYNYFVTYNLYAGNQKVESARTEVSRECPIVGILDIESIEDEIKTELENRNYTPTGASVEVVNFRRFEEKVKS